MRTIAGSTIARASSGSRPSINSIEPLMSANNAVTVLRSPSGAADDATSAATRNSCAFALDCGTCAEAGFDAAGAPLGALGAIGLAQLPQNLNPGGFSNPHCGQRFLSG